MRPLVSVIVPTLNRRDMVAAQVEALRTQTYPMDRFEVLIVDNGSTDGTVEWADSIAANLPFSFRFIVNRTQFRVPAQSRNIGFRESCGEIVAFTDSDCIVSPEWLQEGVATLMADATLGLVQGMTLPWEGTSTPTIYRTIRVESPKAYYETCNMFYRRAALEKVSGFHREFIEDYPYPTFGEDTDLAYRVIEAGFQNRFAPSALVWHRKLPQSLRSWMREPANAFSWPLLVKRHPRIRRDLLFGGVFLTPMTALFDLGLLSTIPAFLVSPFALLLWVPFLIAKYREGGGHLSLPMRLVRVAGGSLRAVYVFMVLLRGSVYFRTPVL